MDKDEKIDDLEEQIVNLKKKLNSARASLSRYKRRAMRKRKMPGKVRDEDQVAPMTLISPLGVEMDGVYAKDLVYCRRFKARLSVEACAARWDDRRESFPGELTGCQGCPIGRKNSERAHADVEEIE